MRTNTLLIAFILTTAGCELPSLSGSSSDARDADEGARVVPETPPDTAAATAARYDELRITLDAKRSRLASGVDRVATAPNSVYFTYGAGTVHRASLGVVAASSVIADLDFAASDSILVVRAGEGWTARDVAGGEVLGAVDVDSKEARFTEPAVEGSAIYLHGFGPNGERAVYAWQPGAEPTLHALLPNSGVLKRADGSTTLDGNLDRIGVSSGSVYVLLYAPGIVYGGKTGSPVHTIHVGSTILSAAFYPDGVLVGSVETLPELALVRVDTGAVTKVHEALAQASAPEGLPADFARVKDYAAGGERVGPYVVYVGGAQQVGTSGMVTGVFAYDERSGRIFPLALAPLDGARSEGFTSVHVTSDRGVYVTSVVDGTRALSYLDGSDLLRD